MSPGLTYKIVRDNKKREEMLRQTEEQKKFLRKSDYFKSSHHKTQASEAGCSSKNTVFSFGSAVKAVKPSHHRSKRSMFDTV
jgi:hypothetical protein